MRREPELDPVGGAPAWMATYSDAMTLLMTFFVLLLTFSYISPLKNTQKDSGVSPQKGSGGIIGKLFDSNALLWRDHALMTNPNELRSVVPPNYDEQSHLATKEIVKELEKTPLGNLSDSFEVKLNIRFLFEKDNRLSASGKTLIDGIARNVLPMPYDLFIQTSRAGDLDAAIKTAQYLIGTRRFHPGRIGIGIDGANTQAGAISIIFARQT